MTAYTAEEARRLLYDALIAECDYWMRIPTGITYQERRNGIVFSILNIFDGTSTAMPAMDIVLRPHESDKAFDESEGEKWFERGMVINEDVLMHDEFYQPAAATVSRG